MVKHICNQEETARNKKENKKKHKSEGTSKGGSTLPKTLDLVQGKVSKTLVSFALPFMLSSLLQTLYSTVDTVVVGQYVGSTGLSAVSVSSNLIHLTISLCMGLCSAGQILIAQYVGAKRPDKVKQTIVTMSIVTIAFSAALGIIVFLCIDPLLQLMSIPSEAFQMAREYMMISSVGILFTGLYDMASSIFRGMGDRRRPFIFIAIASLVNVVLDLLFVGPFHMAAAGAALATVISQIISVIYCFVFLLRHREEYHVNFSRGEFFAPRECFASLIKLGIPLMLSGSAVSISGLFVSRFVNQLGVAVSAAFGVGQKLSQVPNILATSIGQAGTAMMGQNLGAHEYGRVRGVVRSAVVINGVVTSCFSIACLIAPRFVFRMFTQDESVLAYAAQWCIAMAIGAPAVALLHSFNGLIQAVGDTRISMCIGLADAFAGRIALTVLLGIVLDLGAFGFFCGYTGAAYLTALPGAFYYFFVDWKKRGIHAQ